MLYCDSSVSHTIVGCSVWSHEVTIVVLVLLVPLVLARPHTESNAADQRNEQNDEEDSNGNSNPYDGSNWKIVIPCKREHTCNYV